MQSANVVNFDHEYSTMKIYHSITMQNTFNFAPNSVTEKLRMTKK